MSRSLRVRKCECGSEKLRLNHSRIAEDAMSSWVSCMTCGAMGEETDDAYTDPEGAADLWNRYPRTKHPANALSERQP